MRAYKPCSKYNLSWAMVSAADSRIIRQDEDGYPAGIWDQYYFENLFYETMSEVKRNKRCIFKWYNQLGKKLENGSYDGSMDALVQSDVDTHFRPMDYFIEDGLVDFSTVIASSRFEIFHAIVPKERKSSRTSLQELLNLLFPSTALLVWFLVANLFYLISAFLLARTIRKSLNFGLPVPPRKNAPSRRNFLSNFGSIIKQQLRDNLWLLRRSDLSRVLLITYVLFLFLIQTILSMNIKTERVVVDTSDLIHSAESLRRTKRSPCFPENGRELEVFTKAPRGTLAHYIYYEMAGDAPFFALENDKLNNINLEEWAKHQFVVGSGEGIKIAAGYGGQMYRRDTFYGQTSVAQILRVYYLSKRLPKKVKEFLGECLTASFTLGLFEKIIRDLPRFLPPTGEKEFKVYTSLKQYVDQFTLVEDMDFEKIQFLFKNYFTFLSLILNIYLADLLFKFSFGLQLIKRFRAALRKFKRDRKRAARFERLRRAQRLLLVASR